MSDPLKEEVERRNKYGIVESSKPHPPAKVEISQGTVLLLLRQLADYHDKWLTTREALLKELGQNSLDPDVQVLTKMYGIQDKGPFDVTPLDAEKICKLADAAREDK